MKNALLLLLLLPATSKAQALLACPNDPALLAEAFLNAKASGAYTRFAKAECLLASKHPYLEVSPGSVEMLPSDKAPKILDSKKPFTDVKVRTSTATDAVDELEVTFKWVMQDGTKSKDDFVFSPDPKRGSGSCVIVARQPRLRVIRKECLK